MKFLEIKDVLVEKELKRIQATVFSNEFYWFYKTSTMNRFKFNSFTLFHYLKHDDPYPYKKYFEDMVYAICKKYQVPIEKILRMNLNLTFHRPEAYGDIHIDHEIEHKTMILYLNNSEGKTIVYKEKYDKTKKHEYPYTSRNFNIEKEIQPEENKCFIFEGLHYHTSGFPKPGQERYIFICTFQ